MRAAVAMIAPLRSRRVGLASSSARAAAVAARIGWLLPRLAALLLCLLLAAAPGWADSLPVTQSFRCEGDPLTALLVRGAVDDPTIPDPSRSPVPVGGVVVLEWRELRLQLPRTNNAGPASFTDGRWWWSLEDPAHPRFRLRRGLGDVQDFACEASA